MNATRGTSVELPAKSKAPKRLTLDQRRKMARKRITELHLEDKARKQNQNH
jgi:hypothetical protein